MNEQALQPARRCWVCAQIFNPGEPSVDNLLGHFHIDCAEFMLRAQALCEALEAQYRTASGAGGT